MLLSAATFAQSVPQTVNFSATVRDANNQLLADRPITVRLTIYEGGEGGTPVYCAMHQTTTNANGFMSFQLNRDVFAYCNDITNIPFDEIPWGNGNYWMYVEYQALIGEPFESLGYLEITSGFYAFAADRALVAQKLEGFDIDVTNAQDGDILVYNGTTRKWEARRPENIGGGSSQQETYTEGTFRWTRQGTQSSGFDEFGLVSGNVNSDLYLNINAMEGARLYILSSSDYAITDINTLNIRLTSETQATVYNGVNVGYASHSYDDVIATVYNGKTYLIHVTNSVSQSETAGTLVTITGTYKMWGSGSTASTYYSEPTGYTNGYGYVDLGLPSGTRWATCNVGASTPTAYGNYYAWGETTTKSSYTSDNYTYSDNPTTLPSNRDAATANWGSGWRMPTYDELYELQSNCTVTRTTQSGVNGRLFTGPNGNSIFLPAAGYRFGSELVNAGSNGSCWSSSLYTGNTGSARGLYFTSAGCFMDSSNRYYGFTVRAVCASQN